MTFQESDIRVGPASPLYGDGPYTVHMSGCGQRGEFIQVTPDYIRLLDDNSTETYGPPENIFVHEWAKFRYGVFEEFGYPGDARFPAFYERKAGQEGSEFVPNYCTNVELMGEKRYDDELY